MLRRHYRSIFQSMLRFRTGKLPRVRLSDKKSSAHLFFLLMKNPYANRFRNVFFHACEVDWIDPKSKIESVFKEVCPSKAIFYQLGSFIYSTSDEQFLSKFPFFFSDTEKTLFQSPVHLRYL
jgi:hypothetical protein